MSHPDQPPSGSAERRSDDAAQAWGGDYAEETQVVRPPMGGYPSQSSGSGRATEDPKAPGSSRYDPAPLSTGPASGPFPQPLQVAGRSSFGAVNPDPSAYGSPESTVAYSAGPGYGSPLSSAEPAYPADPAPAASYAPPVTPSYAPPGYAQPQYVPPPQAGYQAAPTVVARESSRGLAGVLSALIGLVLVGVGVFLVAKYGFAAGQYQQQTLITSWKDVGLAVGGAALLLAAVILNGWSPWATLIPGVALTGLGAWALVSPSGLTNVTKLTNFALKNHEAETWHLAGFTLVLGMVLLAASIATMIARTAGRRSASLVQ